MCKTAVILDGKATVHMFPYSTMRTQRVSDEFEGLDMVPDGDTMPYWMLAFRLIEQFLIDIDFEPSDNSFVKGLKLYWENRNGDMAERATLFSDTIPAETMAILLEAFNNTREELPGVSDVLAAGKPDRKTDPEVSSGGGKKSRK